MLTVFRVIVVAILLMLPQATLAKSLVLLISNEELTKHEEVKLAYEDQGYLITGGASLDVDAMRAELTEFFSQVSDSDMVVVHFTGRATHFGEQSWIMPAGTPADLVVNVDYTSPSLGVIFEALAQKPGRAVFLLGEVAGAPKAPLLTGVDSLRVPQGVLFVGGSYDAINELVINDLLARQGDIAQILAVKGGALRIEGFASPDISLARIDTDQAESDEDADAETATDSVLRGALGDGQKTDAEISLGNVLAEKDNASAQVRRVVITEELIENAKTLEASLGLSRDDKLRIQANLTMLGHNTRGVDGVLGSGSRGAILEWQNVNGDPATSFLNASQIESMQSGADVRRAEIEADDREFWATSGNSGEKASLKTYLDNYPAGIYADEAKTALNQLERVERQTADETSWNVAAQQNTTEGYRAYLAEFSNGIHANSARQKLQTLDPGSVVTDDLTSMTARAQEDRLHLTNATRVLIEGQLFGSGQNPGTVDGVFTNTTRSAIYQYQKSKGIPATGYISQATVQALLLG